MRNKQVTHCIVDFESDRLRLRAINARMGNVMLGDRQITEAELQKACVEYWKFVDHGIEHGRLTEAELNAFYDDLKTRGANLAKQLLDHQLKQQLWKVAAQSDVLVMITDLLYVPWEALFNADTKPNSFLSDLCVLTRWPQRTGLLSRDMQSAVRRFGTDRVICLDRLLVDYKMGTACIEELLKQDGEDVYVTSLKGELVQRVSDVRLIHWICEHASDGLRLDEKVYYTADDAGAHRFPRGAIVVLTSCSSGAATNLEASIASSICVGSHCTVIAPSSVVATQAGVEFARKMNSVISVKRPKKPLRVTEFWRQLKLPAGKVGVSRPTPDMCFALWYGIYGNGEAVIRE